MQEVSPSAGLQQREGGQWKQALQSTHIRLIGAPGLGCTDDALEHHGAHLVSVLHLVDPVVVIHGKHGTEQQTTHNTGLGGHDD